MASFAVTTANWAKRSIKLNSLAGRLSSGTKPSTSAACLKRSCSKSDDGTARMPHLPSTSERQKASRVSPIALMTPIPVMTTRGTSAFRGGLGFGLDQVGDTRDHLGNVLNLLCLFIINLDVEFTLEVEEDVQAVQ